MTQIVDSKCRSTDFDSLRPPRHGSNPVFPSQSETLRRRYRRLCSRTPTNSCLQDRVEFAGDRDRSLACFGLGSTDNQLAAHLSDRSPDSNPPSDKIDVLNVQAHQLAKAHTGVGQDRHDIALGSTQPCQSVSFGGSEVHMLLVNSWREDRLCCGVLGDPSLADCVIENHLEDAVSPPLSARADVGHGVHEVLNAASVQLADRPTGERRHRKPPTVLIAAAHLRSQVLPRRKPRGVRVGQCDGVSASRVEVDALAVSVELLGLEQARFAVMPI